MEAPTVDEQAYDAFLSYASADKVSAAVLQRRLELRYRRLPRSVRAGKKHLAVCRDETDFTARGSVAGVIEEKLRSSRKLVVLASPSARASEWVDKEIRTHREAKTSSALVLVALDGADPLRETAFPAALVEGGAEPLAIDFRPQRFRDGREHRRFIEDDGPLRILAALLDLSYPELVDRQRAHDRAIARRNLLVASVLALVFVGLGAVALVQRNEARAANARSERSLGRAFSSAASETAAKGRPAEALVLAAMAMSHDRDVAVSPTPEELLTRVGGEVWRREGPFQGARGPFTLTRSGKCFLALDEEGVISGWSVPDGVKLGSFPKTSSPLRFLSPTRDPAVTLAGTMEGEVLVLDTSTWSVRHRALVPPQETISVTPDARAERFLVIDEQWRARLLDARTGRDVWNVQLRESGTPRQSVQGIHLADKGSFLLACADRSSLELEADTGREISRTAPSKKRPRDEGVWLTPTGDKGATLTGTKVEVWQRDTGVNVWTSEALGAPAISFCISPDERSLLAILQSGITALDSVNFEPLFSHLSIPGYPYLAAAVLLPESDICLATPLEMMSAGVEGDVLRPLHPIFYDAKMKDWVGDLLGSGCRALAWTPDGRRIVSGDYTGRISTWSADDGRLLAEIGRQSAPILSLAVSPDGRSVVAGDLGGHVVSFDIDDGRKLFSLRASSAPIRSITFSPDGRRIATVAAANLAVKERESAPLKIWNALDGSAESPIMMTGVGDLLCAFIERPGASVLCVDTSRVFRLSLDDGALMGNANLLPFEPQARRPCRRMVRSCTSGTRMGAYSSGTRATSSRWRRSRG